MNPIAFQHKWLANTTKERSSSQSHFNDLCALVNHPTPNDLDPKGEFFAFERGASKLRGGEGWADVWYRGKFAVEYKGRGKDLKAAYDQLAQYREDLENPPLLIVSDLDRIEIHTNFTGTIKQVHAIDLASIVEPASIDILRKAFYEPDPLKPPGHGRTGHRGSRQPGRADGRRVASTRGRPAPGRALPDAGALLPLRGRHRHPARTGCSRSCWSSAPGTPASSPGRPKPS